MLKIFFPGFDHHFLFDHSSGHTAKVHDGLTVTKMVKKACGKKQPMRDTVMSEDCLGPYVHEDCLKVGDIQRMYFQEEGKGPFYMKPRDVIEKKFDRKTGKMIKVDKDRYELFAELFGKKLLIGKHQYNKEALQKIACQNGISTKKKVEEIQNGWVNCPKGVFQVLWEHGWIDPSVRCDRYTMKGKDSEMIKDCDAK